MGDILLGIVIAVVSGLLTILFFSLIILPLFYGIPRALWWAIKGRRRWNAPLLYTMSMAFGLILLLGGSFLSQYFFPEFIDYILNSWGILTGIGLGALGGLHTVLTVKGRDDLNRDFLNRMAKPFYSKKGGSLDPEVTRDIVNNVDNCEKKRINIEDLDFDEISIVYDELKRANYGVILSGKYNDITCDAALRIVKEEQITIISDIFRRAVSLYGVSGSPSRVVIDKLINDPYIELDLESKHELVPLFYPNETDTISSSMFSNRDNIRDEAYEIFLEKLDRDKLNIDDVMREYKENNPLYYLGFITEKFLEYRKDIDD